MHHLYPLAKGDPLCPLGFHPQVRWPTRCKRCFRDYKEHGGKKREDDSALRRDEIASSSPSLNSWGSLRNQDDNKRSWASSTNLAPEKDKRNAAVKNEFNSPASWTSTPDLANLEDNTQANIPTISLTLPKRKQLAIDKNHRTVSDSFSITRRDKSPGFTKTDSLAARAKKMQALKEKEAKEKPVKRIQIKELKSVDEDTNDVQFLIKVKTKLVKEEPKVEVNEGAESEDDTISLAGTETTDTTLVGDRHDNELQEQIDSLKQELETMKTKCDRVEREKSDLLLRRLAAKETTTSKTTATEVLKLQQRCNELQSQLEDFKDDKKSLTHKVKELEEEIDLRPTVQAAQKIADELRSKLLAAETLCEELMDENEDMKKELRDLEEEIEEMQDNFREDQADEYSSLKKELEQTTKNCRILSFKLRKNERRAEQLENEKTEAEKKLKDITGGTDNLDRIKHLEQDLKVANEVATRLQKELDEANTKLSKAEETTTKTPKLGNIPKLPSGDGKVSRASLTRGGSQDDPVQLLRDLHDSMEREADLREQLKFAEEEAQNLRKKVSRIEDDNESLVLQLKKMATKARSRKLSPNSRLTPEPNNEKDEGISEEDDPNELKLLLELNEQEASVLRKKAEELEAEKDTMRRKIKDLQDKLAMKTTIKKTILGSVKGNSIQDQKLKVLEDETSDLRKKLIEKERETERLHAELSLTQKRSKGMQKSKSLDLDQHALDLKRQLQVIEQEAAVLRSKVQSLESENEKITGENKRLQLLRGTKNLRSDKSVNLDRYIDKIAELEIDLGEANKTIKTLQENTGESSNKYTNSDKTDTDSLKDKLNKVESERDKLSETLNKIKEDAVKFYKDRTPKKPSDFTSKLQLKNMVNDLENEIGEMIIAMKNYENTKSKLEKELEQAKKYPKNDDLHSSLKELDELKNKLKTAENELKEEKSKTTKERKKIDELNSALTKSNESLNKALEEKKQLLEAKENAKEECKTLSDEKKKLTSEIVKIKADLKTNTANQEELSVYKQKMTALKDELDTKEKELASVRKELEEKSLTAKEMVTKTKKITELEKQVKENEELLKKTKKQSQDQIKRLETQLEDERSKTKLKETQQTDLSSQWSADRKVLNVQIDELNTKIKSMENIIATKTILVEQLEETVRKEREAGNLKATSAENAEINRLREEVKRTSTSLREMEAQLEVANKNKKIAADKLKKLDNDYKKEKLSLEKKVSELDIDLQNEKKKVELLRTNHEKEHKNREFELSTLKTKIKTLELNSGAGNKKLTEIKQEYQERIDKVEATLKAKKQEYDDLTAKYEILEEEHVVTKAKLVMEKENLNHQLTITKRELENLDNELQTLRETYSNKQNNLTKEKTELQGKLRDLEKNANGNDTINLEKTKLKALLEEKQSELDQIKREYEVIHDQMEFMRRENDESKKMLDDYDKVSKIQRNISADSSAMEKEIRLLRNRLAQIEKAKKTDLAECKMRYDSQIAIVSEELQSLQTQVTRFKRERDTYKHMLEGAQKTIGDLKASPSTRRESRTSIGSFDELEESRSKVATLEQQISCMEDELSEARLEASKLKTELVSERSSWEVKLSELHSRVNELEEERILTSGRTKIPGLRTRMELAWQKEREEQQRLLQETSTLARDLRQTLFEVERERDKERLESKRKQEQLKKASEEDQDETKRKLTELQCDLLELRDAHAKLRTTNEKLRREKERHEKEREEFKALISGKRRAEQDDERRINALLEQVETLIQLSPDFMPYREKSTEPDNAYTPTPPRRIRSSKSRESSPALEKKDFSKESSMARDDYKPQIHSVMRRLADVTDELRRYQRLGEEERDRERIKRAMGSRRATSTEHDNVPDTVTISRGFLRNGSAGSVLHRRSLSLEQTSVQNEQNIWRTDNDSLSSLTSLEAGSDMDTRWSKRDTSFDSRLSGGSTQSDTGTGEKKKKKGIMGKLKKLTKARSIDDQDPGNFSPTGALSSKPNSNSDVNEDVKGSKKDLRERLTGMFKRGGSSSRSNSLERQKHDTSSTQRPLMPNGSNSNISRTSPSPEVTKVSSKIRTVKHK